LRLSREGYREAGDATGFLPETLEKVVRLGELLGLIFQHPYLRSQVLLKGGTALNLMLETPRRLSVDIDLNKAGAANQSAVGHLCTGWIVSISPLLVVPLVTTHTRLR